MNIRNIIKNAHENLSDMELSEIMRCHKKEDLIWFHNSIGQNIRNDIGLWHNEEMCKEFEKETKLSHPDDISMYILEEIWEDLQIED